jgi:phage tail-like protein
VSAWLEKPDPSAMEVSLCDETGVPVIAWRIAKALPVKLTAPTFDASANQLSIDSLEIRAAGIALKHLT